jgi:hypothetical protein
LHFRNLKQRNLSRLILRQSVPMLCGFLQRNACFDRRKVEIRRENLGILYLSCQFGGPVSFNTQAGEYSRVNLQIVVVHSTAFSRSIQRPFRLIHSRHLLAATVTSAIPSPALGP